jgi:hypothetical protein
MRLWAEQLSTLPEQPATATPLPADRPDYSPGIQVSRVLSALPRFGGDGDADEVASLDWLCVESYA